MSSRSSVIYNPVCSSEEVSEAADADSIRLSIEAPGCELPEGRIELQSLNNENEASTEHSAPSVVNGDSYAICGKEIGFLKACFKPTPIEECKVTLLDVFMLAFAAVTYAADIITDFLLFFTYSQNAWSLLTLLFLLLPTVMGAVFAMVNLLIRERHTIGNALLLSYSQFPGVLIFWLVKDLYRGYKALKNKDKFAALIENLEAPEYRLFEAYGEAAPQLTLQLYIMLQDTNKIKTIQWVSSVVSLISLSFATVSDYKFKYQKKGRFKIPHLGMVLFFGWHLLTVLPRTIAFAIFSNVSPGALFMVVAFHAVAAIMFFLFTVNFKDGKHNQPFPFLVMTLFSSYTGDFLHNSRLKYLFFQTIIYLENVIMLLLWYFSPKSGNATLWLRCFCFVSITVGYLFGVLLKIVYYVKFHPKNFHSDETKHIKICVPWKEWVTRMSRSEIEIRRRRKEIRKWREAKTKNAEEIQRQEEEIHRQGEEIKQVENIKIRKVEQEIEKGKIIQVLNCAGKLGRKIKIREQKKEIKRLKNEIVNWAEETRKWRETREIRIEESRSNEQRSNEQESEIEVEKWHQSSETEGCEQRGSENQGNNEQGSGVNRETKQVGAEVGREEQGSGGGERETTEANFEGGCAEQGINGQDDRAEVIDQYYEIGLQVFFNITLIFFFSGASLVGGIILLYV